MEEFLEEQVRPLDAGVKVSQRRANVAGVEDDAGYELLAFLL